MLGTQLSSRDIIRVRVLALKLSLSLEAALEWRSCRRVCRRGDATRCCCGSLDAAHQRVCLLWIYDPIKTERLLFAWAGGHLLAHFPIIVDCFCCCSPLAAVSFWSGQSSGLGVFGVNCQMAVTTSLVPLPRIFVVVPLPHPATVRQRVERQTRRPSG